MSVSDLDRELLTRCLDRKNRAWEDFVDRFLGLVLHVIDHTASRRDVRLSLEERNTLCENVFAALGHDNYRLLRNFRGKSSLTSYLSIVVRRIVVRMLLNRVAATEKTEYAYRSGGSPTSPQYRDSLASFL